MRFGPFSCLAFLGEMGYSEVERGDWVNIVSSLILLALFVIVFGLIIEVFTVLFQLTGLTREKARTQVISLLTNCGFTTSESELVLSSKRRRRLARVAMLLGYAFAVVIVSLLVNMFMEFKQAEVAQMVGMVVFLGLFFLCYVVVMRLKRVQKAFDALIERLGNRVLFGKQSNVLVLIDILRENAMVEVVADHLPPCLKGCCLAESGLKERHHIQILYIKRNGESLRPLNGETRVEQGDFLLLFGEYKEIRAVFERPEEQATGH